MPGVEEHWIRWWCAPWEWAHTDWKEGFAAQLGIHRDECDELLRTRHSAFLQSSGIIPSQPPQPVEPLMQWLQLSEAQQHLALSLAGSICLGQGNRMLSGDVEQVYAPWCRAVAKALRPGVWMDACVEDPRVLLAAWVGEACWSRLRLSWAPETLPRFCAGMPGNKLQTLWHSVIWRVTTS